MSHAESPTKKFKWAKMGAGAVGRSDSECKRVFEEEEEEEEGAPPTNVTGYNALLVKRVNGV